MPQTCAAATTAVGILCLVLSACSADTAPAAAVAPAPPAAVTAAPEPATPKQVAAEIIRWFTTAGYKRYQAEALADHAAAESGFRPCAAGPGGLRHTYQWGGLRLHRLRDFADTGGACPPLAKQLAFADWELRTNGAFACFWQATMRETARAALYRGFGRGMC